MRRALIAAGLSVVLLGAAASSASAVTFSPTSSPSFGNQPRYTISPPQTLTLTKEAQYSAEYIDVGATINRFLDSFIITSDCPVGYLTATHPSCTVTARFTPYGPGTVTALITTGGESGSTLKPTATFTGTGTKPCVKKKQNKRLLQYKKHCKGFPRYIAPNA
jgi:hypothetical protein